MTDELRALVERDIETLPWRCFHCDDVFTDRAAALEHFGETADDDPLCKIKADEGGLAGEIRRLNKELSGALDDRNSYENDARLWYESEADRVRRIGQVQWWQELDSKEGECLVLQERVKEVEALLLALHAGYHQEITSLRADREGLQALANAFIEGQEASIRGLPRASNPYPPGDSLNVGEQWSQWDDGYDCNINRALKAELAAYHRAQAAREWQPIETAPKDGRRVLVYCERDSVAVARYQGNAWASIPGGYGVYPTLWAPIQSLPATPVATPPRREQP